MTELEYIENGMRPRNEKSLCALRAEAVLMRYWLGQPIQTTTANVSETKEVCVKLNGHGLRGMEDEAIRQTLVLTGGNKEKACRLLKISRGTLYSRT